jgi:hypothetical protein
MKEGRKEGRKERCSSDGGGGVAGKPRNGERKEGFQ